MRVTTLELGPFLARCVILSDEHSDAAIIVDPGFEARRVVAEVQRQRLAPEAIVLTHAHLDHAFGVPEVKEAFPSAPVLLHGEDVPLYGNLAMQAQVFGFPPPPAVPYDRLLSDGDRLQLGCDELLVRHTPGHSPGHIVLIHESGQPPLAVVGDVLFAGSIGRTDLWGGSLPALVRSIREVLYRLPPTTRVVPGHGPDTTIGEEIVSNPFVSGR